MDFALLTPFAVFGAIAAGAWWLLEAFSRRKGSAERRLEEFKDPRVRRRGDESAMKKSDPMTRALESVSPSLAKPLQPKSEYEVNKLKMKLSYAGFRGETVSTVFLGIKFVSLIIGLFLGGGSLLLVTGFTINGMFKAAMFAGAFFYAPDAILWWLGKRRKDQIFRALPDALDLMVVCVEARPWPRPGDAPRGGRNEKVVSGDQRRIRPLQSAIANGPPPRRSAARSRPAHRR